VCVILDSLHGGEARVLVFPWSLLSPGHRLHL
jgi:hypothetical protein